MADELRWLGGTYERLRCGAGLTYAGRVVSDGGFESDCAVDTAHKLFCSLCSAISFARV